MGHGIRRNGENYRAVSLSTTVVFECRQDVQCMHILIDTSVILSQHTDDTGAIRRRDTSGYMEKWGRRHEQVEAWCVGRWGA